MVNWNNNIILEDRKKEEEKKRKDQNKAIPTAETIERHYEIVETLMQYQIEIEDMIFESFVDEQINKINDFFKYEEYFLLMLNNKQRKSKQFIIVDNKWIEKWKEIVKYELIKIKCRSHVKKQNPLLKKEISITLKTNNSMKKFNELIKKDSSKIKKGKKIVEFKEESNFFPIENQQLCYFSKEFALILGMGDYFNGKLFLHKICFDKEENQKIVVFEKKLKIINLIKL